MSPQEHRRYLTTHPWITFSFTADRLSPTTWALLGEAASKCEHLAGSAMPPAFAQRLNQVSLERGAHGTTSIEGNTLTEDEVRAVIEGSATIPPSRAYQAQEIKNLLDLFNAITRDCLEEPPPLSATRLKEQHALLMTGQPTKEDVVPGELRTHDVVVGRYRGAPPEDCEYLVDTLCDWLNRELRTLTEDTGVLRYPMVFILAILAHLHLTWIHPFGDGNGRISRLLELEILLRAGVPVPAAHLLSDHYNKTRDMYYAVLERTSRDPRYPVEQFIDYAVQGLVDGLREHIEKVQAMQMGVMWQSYVHECFSGQHTPTSARMRDVVLALPPDQWTRRDDIIMLSKPINEAYGAKTTKTMTRDLNKLEEMGLIERRPGRGVRPRVEIMAAFLPARQDQLS